MASENHLFLLIICVFSDITQVMCPRPTYHEQMGLVDSIDASGKPAYAGQYPWSVRLAALRGSDMFFGGVLINPSWVLTVASQLEDVKTVRIWLGGLQSFDPHEKKRVTMFSKKFYIHPDFENTTNDIALIKLPQPAPSYMKPIGIAQANDIQLGSQTMVVGYGKKKDEVSRSLRSVPVKITAMDDCLGPCLDNELSDVHLCTKGKDGEGPCGGDYGSPLIFKGRLIGLVSCFPITCDREKAALYTKMTKFNTWVTDTIKEVEYNETLADSDEKDVSIYS